MFRRVFASNLIFASLLSVGCQLVADFEKDGSSSAGTGAAPQGGANTSLAGNGSKPISGGTANSSLANTTNSSGRGGTESATGGAGGAVTTTATVNGGDTAVATATTLATNGGTAAGGAPQTSPNTVTSTSGGVAATTSSTNANGGTSNGGAVNGGTTQGLVGGTTAVTGGTSSATGGATAGGTKATGGAATGGAATGGAATGGAATGGTKATGGAATGGVATGGTKATGGSPTGGAATSSAVTIPTVVSISPTNGAKGVTQDATIQITFSEPMSAASVASSLSVSGFTAGDLTLRWADNNKKLTVTPSGGFSYATGSAPTAIAYTVNLTTGATDADGTHLATPFTSSFQALRRIQRMLAPEQVASYDTYGPAVFKSSPIICSDAAGVIANGSWSGRVSSGVTFAYLVFNLSAIGTTSEVYSFDWANLRATQNAATGDFYSNGYVFVERLTYTALESITTVDDGVDTWGTLSNSTSGTYLSLGVTSPFSARFKAGDTRILLRTRAGGIYPENTNANFTCGGFGMELSYLTQ